MELAKHRIEVFYHSVDDRGKSLAKKLEALGCQVKSVELSDNYLLNIGLTAEQVNKTAQALTQAVTQSFKIDEPYVPVNFDYAVEIGFLPGVTDNVAHTTREIIEDLFKEEVDKEKGVFTTKTFFFSGNLSMEKIEEIAKELYNPVIERAKILSKEQYLAENGMGKQLPVVHLTEETGVDVIDLDIPEEEFLQLGKMGILNKDGSRRGPLALDKNSLDVIKRYFSKEKRNPTDIELESIAQTWSEHCKHTIFAAEIDEIKDGFYKHYIKASTNKIRQQKGEKDFCCSVFTDNAGGIKFGEDWIVSDKVETHNSPSALDPFGGSITGIVGVNRDAMGFGKGAKPIANRYGFCFANPFDKKPLYKNKTKESKLLSPRRIMEGVIQGVNVGGNCSGIPTPQGFVYFDERYKGKPLVFVGTVGLMPATVNNQPAVEKKAEPNDYVVITGGRVGLDGIHGATFSSEALSSGSPATAVQIGDPITQKKMSDAIVKEARDLNLYNSITDNGAGGLSCSVAEMAREAGGFSVDLEKIPLKYHGMAPWQIWVSESQERMTFSIPEEKLETFLDLMKRRGVEATVIGQFNDSDRAIVKNNGEVIFDLDMDFLHDGLPKKVLSTTLNLVKENDPQFNEPSDYNKIFSEMNSRLNTASYEFISTQYDYEVQANSVIKPLQGKGHINGNASVIRPLLTSKKGVVLSQCLYPSYSEIDPYKMAAASIDTAVRNAISVGGTLDELALLDNFCWCDSTNPERLGELKEAVKACYDYSIAYGTPFVSGKDSMFNDFKGYDENFEEVMISVPPTLLVSSFGVVDDVTKCQTIDFKYEDDLVYVLGETADELGGSEYYAYMGETATEKAYRGGNVPTVNTEKNISLYRQVEAAFQKDLIVSSISVERGGLGIALAKSAMAGCLGADLNLTAIAEDSDLRADNLLFSESQGRLVVTINPAKKDEFESLFVNNKIYCVGKVSAQPQIKIACRKENLVNIELATLATEHKDLLGNF